MDTARALEGEGTRSDNHLGRANELLRQAHRELDVLIHELRPAMLEGRGLGGALREYAAGWSRGSEIPAEVLVRDEGEASLEVEQALFRIAQEALANVARHPGASRAGVELAYETDAVLLRVESDPGRGTRIVCFCPLPEVSEGTPRSAPGLKESNRWAIPRHSSW